MNSAPQMPAQEPDNESGDELQAVAEVLRNKGIDPERAVEALSNFKEAMRKFGDAMNAYNEAANVLAVSTGVSLEEGQMAKYPEKNMRPYVDQDLKKYFRLSKSVGGSEISDSEELPVELL